MENTFTNNLETSDNSKTLYGNNSTLEFVLLNKIDYEYVIEEFIIDTNRFQILEEKEAPKKEEKEKKKLNSQKEKGNKKQKGGKKKKKEEEDLNLSKASSNLSIFTIKSKSGNVKQSADQKIKAILAKQKNLNVNVLIEKKKNQIEIVKTEKIGKENLPLMEEIIDTNQKVIEEEEEKETKKSQQKKNNKKKNEKVKEKSKQQVLEKPSKENEKSNQQNKRVEDFLKSVKEKKTSKAVKEEKKVSIKSEFISTHKYLFTVDPTQRLKLRSLYKLDKDTIQSFFNIVNNEINFDTYLNNYDNINQEILKNNIKETAFLIDNLCELSIINESDEEIQIIIGRALDLALSSLKLYQERYQSNPNQFKSEQLKSSLENFVMNLLYTVYKYQLEGIKIREEKITRTEEIAEILTKLLRIFVKNKHGKINLKDDEEITFYFFAYGLCLISLSHNKESKEISENFDKLDASVKFLLAELKINTKDLLSVVEDDYDKFVEDYNNLIFFTRLSYLFDKVRPKLFGLSIKVSKSIESNLSQIQNKLIKQNENVFSEFINKIILNYIHNFEVFYEINENLYEEIFGLIKYLCDDKVFSSNYISQLFIIAPNEFNKRLELEQFTFLSDDISGKYIGLLIKYIKYFERVITIGESDFSGKANEYKLFLFYFHQVLFSILNLKQGYIREKYHKIIEKLIEPYLKSDNIAEMIFEYITEFIKNNLLKEFDGNLLKNIKSTKDLTKFYSGYAQVNKNILKIFDKNINSNIEQNLFTLFFLNFLNLMKKEDFQLLQSLISKSENFIENILFFNKGFFSFIMKNYINDEIDSLDRIVNVIFTQLINNKDEENHISFENLFGYLMNYIKNVFVSNNCSERISNLKLATDLIEKLISLNLLKIDRLEILLQNLLIISKDVKFDTIKFDLLRTTILFILNKIILIWKNSSNLSEIELKNRFEYLSFLIENIKKELNPSNNNEFSIENEITLINDNLKKVKPTDYLRTFDDNFLFSIETLKLQQLLQSNPYYFKVDTVEIEKIEQISETEVKTIKDSNMDRINFDLILHGYLNYFSHIRNIFYKLDISKLNIEVIIFNLVTQQESINIILSSEIIFTNLVQNKNLLEEFVKKYIALKELSHTISHDSSKNLKRFETSADSHVLINNQIEITKNLTLMELTSRIAVLCGEFIKYRCKEQIVYLFKEQDIYRMFLTKDKEFLQLLYEKLDFQYKKTILNEENLKISLAKAQNEEEDLLEEVIYSIFSEKIIRYLEYPEEIIEFLTAMNEAMRYDLKVDAKKYYVGILSYFYTWKSIMSKIENGFKLYTTEKNLVTVIDSYKTLLKFIVNYLEKNTKIYEMFLLLTVSLIHLIDEEKSLEDKSTSYQLDKFDDSSLTDELDSNSFQFLLSVLYKFVKIFPSLVKFYYEETKTKLKNTFKSLNTNIILPKMLNDLRERIQSNAGLLAKYQMRIRDTKSLNYLEFDYSANDEIKFVIEIRIPPIFPLKKLDINFKCNAVIDERKLINVKMNLNQTLNSSIDNITDNLINWTENVKQLVIVGNEPCPICYFYLHTTDKSLPGLSCKTCKKKFHGLCIKEWFKNLNQNMQQTSCPMCRSQWKL